MYLLTAACIWTALGADFELIKVKRTITLQDQVIQAVSRITLKNVGTKPLSKFLICFRESARRKVGFVLPEDEDQNKLIHRKLPVENDIVTFRISALTAINPDEEFVVKISAVLGNAYEPLPRQKELLERQWLYAEDSIRMCSPYKVHDQVTVVKMRDNKLVSIDPTPNEEKKSEATYTYGPFKDTPANYNEGTIRMHFRNLKHQCYFTNVDREIEVSHWGNIAVVEKYNLKNGGAELKGHFNRIPFMMKKQEEKMYGRRRRDDRDDSSIIGAMDLLPAVLPRTAHDIDYRDHIGNISSSNARQDHRGYVYVEIKPRYPILGGWTSDYELYYNMPLKGTLKSAQDDSSLYVLNVTFAHSFPSIYAQKMETRIVLPEGAHDIKLQAPQLLDSNVTYKYTWLDYSLLGRPVLQLTVDNFYIPEKFMLTHKFQVIYRFSKLNMIREPIFLSLFFFLFFFVYLVGSRTRLRIMRSGEAELAETVEHNNKIVTMYINAFDDLWSFLRSMIKTSRSFAEMPVEHKWQAYREWAKNRSEKLVENCTKVASAHTGNQLTEYTEMAKRLVTTEFERASLIVDGIKATTRTTTTSGEDGKDGKKKEKEKAEPPKDAKTLAKEAKAKIESLTTKANNIEDSIIKGLRNAEKGVKGE